MWTAIIVLMAISTVALALLLYRLMGRGERAAAAEAGGMWPGVRRSLKFLIGPFPLSVALHVAILLLLIITIHQQRGRELIMVNLEAGGGGGGGSDEMQQLDMPDVPLPESAPIQNMEQPVTADTSHVAALATDYVRSVAGGGIGIGRGGGIGSGYGRGLGAGFGGFIGDLRKKGLDVVLVIDGTGSMRLIIDDVKTKMSQLVRTIHRLVPIARIGVVVYGGKGEAPEVQQLTMSADKLVAFLNNISAKGGGEWEEDTLGACRVAAGMDFRPYAKRVMVLVGDAPPAKEDFGPLLELIRTFRANNGTFNTVDVSAEEHERFEREFWLKVHGREPPSISPLPEFYQQVRQAFKVMAAQGGGAMRSLSKDVQINQQVLILAFGEQWQQQVAAFGRGLNTANK